MNKKWLILGSLLLVAALLGGLLPVQANRARGVNGDFYFEIPPMAGDVFQVWMNIDVREVNMITHKAVGPVTWRVFHPDLGEATVSANASCVLFGADIGEDPNTVILISHVTQSTGWSPAELGEYAYWWLKDDDNDADQFSVRYYDFGSGSEFFPKGKPPTCAYFDLKPGFIYDILEGDLEITR